jgi:hypothetical protein
MRLAKTISGEIFLFDVQVKPGKITVRAYMTERIVEADLVEDHIVPREEIRVYPVTGKKAYEAVKVDKIKVTREFRVMWGDMTP